MQKPSLPPLQGFQFVTKFHGPGFNTGSRIQCSLKRDSETTWRCYVNWDHSLSAQENHIQAVHKLIARHWPEPAEFTEEHRDWQLTVPRPVACCGQHPDAYHWTCVGAWQFSCGAAWLVQQREALGGPVSLQEAV